MAPNLQGRSALVTAAGNGIGAAITRAFAGAGATVAAVDCDAGALSRACDGLSAVAMHRADVTLAAEVEELAAQVGTIDVLVNVVGVVHHGNILECEESHWQRSLEVNVTSMYRLIRRFLPAMLEQGYGRIINVASVVSTIKGVPDRCVYATTKGAVIALSKSVAADFITRGIRCNAICPGTIDTPSLHRRLAASGDYEAALRAFVRRQPMGRLGRSEEVAAMALYLAGDDADLVTGTAMICDGGMSL